MAMSSLPVQIADLERQKKELEDLCDQKINEYIHVMDRPDYDELNHNLTKKKQYLKQKHDDLQLIGKKFENIQFYQNELVAKLILQLDERITQLEKRQI